MAIKKTRFQNMLLGIAIGDAFGVAYEFTCDRIALLTHLEPTKYKSKRVNRKAGMYTDDTQMSIAICEMMLSDKEFNIENLAQRFIDTYRADPIEGYSTTIKEALLLRDGAELLEKAVRNKITNGAAMRSIPLGLYDSIEEVVTNAMINGAVTHNTPEAISSSVAIALMSYYHLHKCQNISLLGFIEPHVRNICDQMAEHLKKIDEMPTFNSELIYGSENFLRGVPTDAIRTVGAVFYIISNYKEPIDVLLESVKLGGDTDSIASMSLGITMINHSVDELPDFLFNDLNNDNSRRDKILDLGNRLTDWYARKNE